MLMLFKSIVLFFPNIIGTYFLKDFKLFFTINVQCVVNVKILYFLKEILISIKIFQIVPIRPKHRKKSKRRRRKKSPSKSMRYPETDDEIDGGYWHLLFLLNNAPNDLVGCVIQKRITIILLPITKAKIFYFTPQDQTTKKSNKMGQKEEKVEKISSLD